MSGSPIKSHSLAKLGDFQRMGASELAAAQDKLLRRHVAWCAARSPRYKKLLRKLKIDASKIRRVEDLRRLPFTEKKDLCESNGEFFAITPPETADVCMTSGTTGDRPTTAPLSRNDILRLAYNEEVSFAMAGLAPGETLLICAALDRCFMAGLAYHLGALRLGLRTIRAGGGSPAQCWNLMKDCGATAAIGVPSLMGRICAHAAEKGGSPRDAGLKKFLAIGEPLRDADMGDLPVTAMLSELLGARPLSTYASTEMATSLTECPRGNGAHLRPELAVIEIIGEDGEPVPPGERGEVVATPLGVEGLPLLRFKTGDVSFMIEEPCACGRTTMRLGPVLGRKNQMLKHKGTTIFPNNILAAVSAEKFFVDGYVSARRGPDGSDVATLHVAVSGPVDAGKIAECVRAKIRVAPEVRVEDVAEIEKATNQPDRKRKKVTFVDLRQQGSQRT